MGESKDSEKFVVEVVTKGSVEECKRARDALKSVYADLNNRWPGIMDKFGEAYGELWEIMGAVGMLDEGTTENAVAQSNIPDIFDFRRFILSAFRGANFPDDLFWKLEEWEPL